jgi:Uma2 family endonuclease
MLQKKPKSQSFDDYFACDDGTENIFMPPPLLVVEVVSPEEFQRERDYVVKRDQYQNCSIPEY